MSQAGTGIDAEPSIGEVDQYTRIVLRRLRHAAGLSLTAAAAAAGCSASSLGRIERSAAPLYFDQLLRLADLYGVGPDEIVRRARRAAAGGWPRALLGAQR